MGLPHSSLDPHTTQIGDHELVISTMQSTIDAQALLITALQSALSGKADVSGQIFAGPISATNLSGNNEGDQIASSVTTTFSDSSFSDAAGISLLGLGLFPTVSEGNARWNDLKDKLNALGSDVAALKAAMRAGSHPILAT
jgi:hypothetical protein